MQNNRALFMKTDNLKAVSFISVLEEVQKYIAKNYSELLLEKPEENKEKIHNFIEKFLSDSSFKVEGLSQEELIEKLYSEMAEYSFLTKYLERKDIEEININSWNSVKITRADGSIETCKEKFNSPEHCIDIIRRLLRQSGIILDSSMPKVRGHLSNKIRISVLSGSLVDKDVGLAASIRMVNPKKLKKKDFINFGTGTEEMLDSLNILHRYGISMCISGATSSGKTTLLAWLLDEIPNHKRTYSIENSVREFDLKKYDEDGNVINNVVQTVTKSSDDPKKEISQEDLLEMALTFNPDHIAVGEMKSSEAFAAQEAARTGHTVLTTTHANSCVASYYRMMTLCKMKYDIADNTLYQLVTEAFPIIVFTKQLENKSRKIMEVTECEILPSGERKINTLFRFNTLKNEIVNGEIILEGEHKRVNTISESLQKRLIENGMPISVLNKLTGGE